MKANRKFVNADEAVSPVIAVILMVAITVVLAATVFVLVSDIGSNTSKTQPSVGWAESEVDDQWDINQAPQQIEYKAYQIKAGGADFADNDVSVLKNNDTAFDELDLTTEYQSLPTGWGSLSGGDFIQFCVPDAEAPEEDIKITLLHQDSNAVANEYTFLELASTCAA